jgi:hypothetical protein
MSNVFAIAVTFMGQNRLEGSKKLPRTHASTELLRIIRKGSTGLGFRIRVLVILDAFA